MPGCNSGVASYSHPGLVSIPSRHCRLLQWPLPRWLFLPNAVRPHKPCDLDVCTGSLEVTVPEVQQSCLFSRGFLSQATSTGPTSPARLFSLTPPLPICSFKLCSSPNWWSIKFTCPEWAPASTWPISCSIWIFFCNGRMPMFIEREFYLKGWHLIWLQH